MFLTYKCAEGIAFIFCSKSLQPRPDLLDSPSFFKQIKSRNTLFPATWNSLKLNEFRPPLTPRAYKDDVKPLLSFINNQLDRENSAELPRGDYKEFLELAKIFLGGDVNRKNGIIYQLSRPGADYHARSMSKCIYFLKLSLLSHQFPQSQLTWQKKKKVETMVIFIIFPYLQSWFTSPSLLGAA